MKRDISSSREADRISGLITVWTVAGSAPIAISLAVSVQMLPAIFSGLADCLMKCTARVVTPAFSKRKTASCGC
jgi:hypothetical protein